jgi:hypothetical protein
MNLATIFRKNRPRLAGRTVMIKHGEPPAQWGSRVRRQGRRSSEGSGDEVGDDNVKRDAGRHREDENPVEPLHGRQHQRAPKVTAAQKSMQVTATNEARFLASE